MPQHSLQDQLNTQLGRQQAGKDRASLCTEFQRTNPEGQEKVILLASKGITHDAGWWGKKIYRLKKCGRLSGWEPLDIKLTSPWCSMMRGCQAQIGKGLIRAALKLARRLLALEPSSHRPLQGTGLVVLSSFSHPAAPALQTA